MGCEKLAIVRQRLISLRQFIVGSHLKTHWHYEFIFNVVFELCLSCVVAIYHYGFVAAQSPKQRYNLIPDCKVQTRIQLIKFEP